MYPHVCTFMCIYICTRIYVGVLGLYQGLSPALVTIVPYMSIQVLCVCVYVCMFMCRRVYMCPALVSVVPYMSIQVLCSTGVSLYVYTYMCICIHIYVCMYTHICVYVYTYMCICIHIHPVHEHPGIMCTCVSVYVFV